MVTVVFNIGRKEFFFFVGFVFIVVCVGGVIAYGTLGPPSVMGHSSEELPNISLECVTLTYRESDDSSKKIYQNSTAHTFDDVGIATSSNTGTGIEPTIECRLDNGWTMTGCSAHTNGDDYDNDEKMRLNGCSGDQHGDNRIYSRCCRIIQT